jgi:phage repressor protein C with HTH and peptisase S24 domain
MQVFAIDAGHPSRTRIQKVTELKLRAGITGFQVEPDRRDGGIWELPTRWIEKHGYVPEHLIAIDVKGESMEPSLYDGDLVVVNTADVTPVSGHVYAVNYEGEAVIKRLVRDAGQWYLSSDNPAPKYGRRLCRSEDCIIVGRVVRRETDQV